MNRRILGMLLAGAFALGASGAFAQQKPTELKIGITTFTSGPASVFGVPAKAAAEILIEDMNAAGGIGGVEARPDVHRRRRSAATSCCPSTGALAQEQGDEGDAVGHLQRQLQHRSRRWPRT